MVPIEARSRSFVASWVRRANSRRRLLTFSTLLADPPSTSRRYLIRWWSGATRLCEAYDTVISLRQADKLFFRAHYGPIPIAYRGRTNWPIGRDWVTGRSVVDCTPVHVHDLQTCAQEFPVGSEMARQLGHRTILSVPLVSKHWETMTEAELIAGLACVSRITPRAPPAVRFGSTAASTITGWRGSFTPESSRPCCVTARRLRPKAAATLYPDFEESIA
jgi:hypothetical protein